MKENRLWLFLHIPNFALDCIRLGAEESAEPTVVSDGNGTHAKVYACDKCAQKIGLYPGMSMGSAWALAGEITVYERDLEQEQAALEGLAAWAYQFTSIVTLEPPNGLSLEIGGSESLFGDLKALVRELIQGIASLGYKETQCCVAPTPTGAEILGRSGYRKIIRTKASLKNLLADIAVENMGLSEPVTKMLRRIGVRKFHECSALPRDGLTRRTHKSAHTAVFDLIERALGTKPDPRAAYVPPDVFDRSLSMPSAVDNTDAILFPLRRLILELNGFLEAIQGGVQTLNITLYSHSMPETKVVLELLHHTREIDHLMELLREKLNRVVLVEPVERLRVCADSIQPLATSNLNLFSGPEKTSTNGRTISWYSVLDRIGARLGSNAVQGVASVAEHRPELAWRTRPAKRALDDKRSTAQITPEPQCARLRPLWLAKEPIPLETVGGRPVIDGVLRLEVDSERIETGWWDGHDIDRDYFLAENSRSEKFWIFRDRRNPKLWYLHGIFS
ncbi:MAG: DNA polymerase Y family protein [Gammaproteobacteria bacterium]|nr:DNA polymerase Y family protein [Gammaproteobacteria bacterium]